MLNVQGSFVSYVDSEARMARVMDAAVRLYLRHTAMHKEKAENLDGALATLAENSAQITALVFVHFL